MLSNNSVSIDDDKVSSNVASPVEGKNWPTSSLWYNSVIVTHEHR